MKITFPDGIVVEGTRDELTPLLPRPTTVIHVGATRGPDISPVDFPRNWDGSPKVTS